MGRYKVTDYRGTHPSKAINKKARMWFGYEVEGRHLGLHTTFIADVLTRYDWEKLRKQDIPQQIFVTESYPFDQLPKLAARLSKRLSASQTLHTVSIMQDRLEEFLCMRSKHPTKLGRFNIIVRLWGKPGRGSTLACISRLRAADQVSIGQAYCMLTFPVIAAVLTLPKAYEGDEL
jgi:hypothetical protein